MAEALTTAALVAGIGLFCAVVGHIGNKIADKGEDAIRNARKRRKNTADGGNTLENLADRYRR